MDKMAKTILLAIWVVSCLYAEGSIPIHMGLFPLMSILFIQERNSLICLCS